MRHAKNGLKSVAEMKRVKEGIIEFNNLHYDRAIDRQIQSFEEKYNKKYEGSKIQEVALSRIDLEFDCPKKELFY